MDFFHSQESLTVIQWTLRAVIAYFFLITAAKLMGQRSIAQLRLLDFIMALTIGNIIAHPLSDESLGLKGSIITVTVLVILYLASILASLKSIKWRGFFDAPPIPLIENGKIFYKNLSKAKISIDILLSELRKDKIEDIQKVALAFWEPGGSLSLFLKPQFQTVTPSDLHLTPEAFVFPRTIIKERKIDLTELQAIGKDENWIKMQLKSKYDADINDILLATIDKNNQIAVFLYD